MLYLVTHWVPPSILSPCYSAWIVTMFPRASGRQTCSPAQRQLSMPATSRHDPCCRGPPSQRSRHAHAAAARFTQSKEEETDHGRQPTLDPPPAWLYLGRLGTRRRAWPA